MGHSPLWVIVVIGERGTRIDFSQGHHVRHWEEHGHTWLFSDIMVPTIQHGQLVVCSDSYHFGRGTHICGWLVFNWSPDSKQALWSVSMPMVIMILMLLYQITACAYRVTERKYQCNNSRTITMIKRMYPQGDRDARLQCGEPTRTVSSLKRRHHHASL